MNRQVAANITCFVAQQTWVQSTDDKPVGL